MGYDDFDDFEVTEERREVEYQWRLATHDQDYADNMECLALATDYLNTSGALQAAYAAKDTAAWTQLTEHLARIKYTIARTFPSLETAILRGDYGV